MTCRGNGIRGFVGGAICVLALSGGAAAEGVADECGVRVAWARLGPATFDAKSGEDPAHYPPDPIVDVKHIKLELTFEDVSSKSFAGVETYTFRPVAAGVRSIDLHAIELDIERVEGDDGSTLDFDYDQKKLTINFPADLPAEADTTVVIHYQCTDPAEGMYFVVPDATYPERPPQLHTLGQAEYNRFWFPSHDFPNERSTTEMIVTVPGGLSVLSNGRLIERTEHGSSATFHWRQDIPHVSYLVTLVIGEFSVIEDEWRGIPVTYWVAKGQEEDARRAFARTPDMLSFFSDMLGYDYPFAQYAQVCVEQFAIGGMEHTTATTLRHDVPYDERAAIDHDEDGLISHELAHQWFGDLITCRTWGHIWLNEGITTFCNDLWYEHWKGRDRYEYDKWRKYREVSESDSSDTPDALVWSRYDHPDDVFSHKGHLPYGKGSTLMHMLRHRLGDEVFFRALREYVRTFALQSVETQDLRRVFEAVSGRSLERFFEQWAYRPGVPRLDIRYRWLEKDHVAEVVIRQTQRIDRAHPAFDFPLDLYFHAGDAETLVTVPVRRVKEVFRRRFESKPDLFCVDPNAGLLKEFQCTKPRPLWLNQLEHGPTVPARCQAAVQLAKVDRPEVVEALALTASDDQEFWGVRAEAVTALGRMQRARARNALISLLQPRGPLANAKVRAAAVEALGQYRHPDITPTLVRLADSDPSYKVEAAATRAIGTARRIEAIDSVLANADKPSHSDRIRRAAAEALGMLGDGRGVETCLALAAYGQPDRTRPTPVAALAQLADRGHRAEHLERFCRRLLSDPERRAQVAAIDALAEMGAVASIDALGELSAHRRRRDLREGAKRAIEEIIADQAAPDAVRLLRARLGELRERWERLHRRMRLLESELDISGDPDDDDAKDARGVG